VAATWLEKRLKMHAIIAGPLTIGKDHIQDYWSVWYQE